MSAQPPRPRSIARSYLAFVRDPLEFAVRCAREVGPIADLPLPGMRMVLLSHPELIGRVLLEDQERYVKDWFTRKLSDVVGKGLLVSEGETWRRQRRLMQPAFHHRRIVEYARVMVAETERMMGGWREGEVRDVHADMMTLTLRIVARTLFGSGITDADAARVERAIAEVMDRFLGVLGTGFNLPLSIPTPGARRFLRAVGELDGIIRTIIQARRDGGPAGDDLLDMLLEARDEDGSRMSDEQLRDECMTLFLAGHETTALNLSYAFFLLGHHPEADARLAAELEEVLGGRSPEAGDLSSLPYLRAVILEALRIYPPAWSIGREAVEEVTLGEYRLPKGTQIWIAPYVSHRDPVHFPEPEAFRPERWLDGLERRLPRYAFIPFGGGPRICIGNAFALTEAALALASVAQRYRLEPTAPPQALELMPSVTLRPKGGIPVQVGLR